MAVTLFKNKGVVMIDKKHCVIWIYLVMVSLLSVLVLQCGDDDDDDSGPTVTPTSSSETTPTPTPTNGPTPSPTSSGGQERIYYTQAYESQNVVYSNIYVMNTDGSAKSQITAMFPYTALEPSLSADGGFLAFTSTYESFKSVFYYDIFSLDLSSGVLQRITGNESVDSTQTGSVTVNVTNTSGNSVTANQVYVSYTGCSQSVQLNNSWSVTLPSVPAGTIWVKAVVNNFIGGYETVTVPANGTRSVSIDLGDGNFQASQPAWSPNGNRIVGVSGYAYYDTSTNPPSTAGFDKIAIWNVSGQFIDDLQNGTGMDKSPLYSPSGNYIVYSKGPVTQESVVRVPAQNLNGTATTIAAGGFDSSSLVNYGYTSPTWSPDGLKLAASFVLTNLNYDLTGNIVIFNADGTGTQTALTSVAQNAIATEPCYSPDGLWIVYTVITSNRNVLNLTDLISYNFKTDIYKKRISGGNPVRLTTNNVSSSPTWGKTSS